jgi:hypothetical protein
MAVTIELQNTGQAARRSEITASIEHAFDGRAGEWHVSILGSHENDGWELKIGSPEGFERSYMLAGSAGEHEPDAIRSLVATLLSGIAVGQKKITARAHQDTSSGGPPAPAKS